MIFVKGTTVAPGSSGAGPITRLYYSLPIVPISNHRNIGQKFHFIRIPGRARIISARAKMKQGSPVFAA